MVHETLNQEIREIILSYRSIIDIDETEETMHLISDLEDLFREKVKDLKLREAL